MNRHVFPGQSRLSFRSCAQLVESPIPQSCATDRIVNSQHAIVGFWSFIGRLCTLATTYYSTM